MITRADFTVVLVMMAIVCALCKYKTLQELKTNLTLMASNYHAYGGWEDDEYGEHDQMTGRLVCSSSAGRRSRYRGSFPHNEYGQMAHRLVSSSYSGLDDYTHDDRGRDLMVGRQTYSGGRRREHAERVGYVRNEYSGQSQHGGHVNSDGHAMRRHADRNGPSVAGHGGNVGQGRRGNGDRGGRASRGRGGYAGQSRGDHTSRGHEWHGDYGGPGDHGGHASRGHWRHDDRGGHTGRGRGGRGGRASRGRGGRGGRAGSGSGGPSMARQYISEGDLQTLSQGHPEEVLLYINDNESKFLSTFTMHRLCTHQLHLKQLVKLLVLLVRCEDQSIATKILAQILTGDGDYGLFITQIDNLLRGMALESREHVKKGNMSLLEYLIEIGSMTIKAIPSTVARTYPVSLIKDTILDMATMGENVDLLVRKFKKMNTDFKLAKKEALREALQKARVSAFIGSEGEPPEPFTELSILPTLEEMWMRSQKVFLRTNKIKGGYSNWGHYFDVQFRLLREDFIRPLREGISDYYYMGRGTGDIREYEGAKVLNPVCLNTGIGFQVRFDVSKLSRVNWEHSKRLIFGSLLCFSNDNFNQCMLFATVVKRDDKLIKEGLLTIQFENGADGFQIDPTQPYKMVESPAYYEAYRHILKSLQDLSKTPDVMPLKKYIIECDFNDVRVPSFLRISSRSPQFDMTDIIFSQTRYLSVRKSFDITGLRTWPNACYTDLDESQLRALQMALTKEVSVIQGPPGTGKTYIGLKIVEAYLKNRTVWDPQKKSPILVVCFTNHALDQFLVDIKKLSVNGDSPNIIRVGGRCKSEELKSSILREKVNECRSNRSIPTHLFKDYKDARSTRFDDQKFISSQLQSCDAESDKKIISLNNLQMVLDLLFIEQLQNGVESAYGKEVEVWLGLWFSEGFESHAPQEAFQQVQPQDDDPSSSDDEYIEVDNEARMLQDDRIIAGDVIEVISAGRSRKKIKVPTKQPKKKDQFGWETVQLTDMQRKKRISHGFKNEPMTSRDASRVRDVWKLSSKNRWKLYLHWTNEYIKHCKKKISTKARDYTLTCNLFAEAQQKIDSFVAGGADVIGMTTTGAAKYHHLLKQVHPKIVIFEEAAEILEAHVITSLASSVQQLILIGDHKQLKPKPTCYDLEKNYHLDVSFFERLINNGFDHVTLQQQHRMRPEISRLLCPTIYENLLDHADVQKYDSVLGIRKNVFFIDHVHPEEHHGSSDTKSHVNKFEADFIVELCHYLLKQGYPPSEITILTMYRGQLFELKSKMKKKNFEGVRVAAVDDFQGEENEIILLSLVRSNSDGVIGFLSIENRVCVSLSRAKKGLYVIGNLSMLRQGKGMDTKWPEIIHHLEKVKCVGPALPLYCQNHPEDKIAIRNPRDFLRRPEGGCTRVCGLRLSCGHTCERICHPRDKEHKLIACSKVCGKTLACGHNCKQKCYKCKKKGSCSLCTFPCEKLLPCGHQCRNTCSDSCTTKCQEKVKKLLPCEHWLTVSCFEEPSSLPCPEKCKEVLECGDVCSGTCGKCQRGRLHVKCLQKCGRDLVCGHPCKYPCASICPPCEMPCNNYCFHSKCPKKCYEPCDTCMEPCKWVCRHHKCTKPCGVLCNRPPCDHPCTKILKCGHQCIGLCGEKCPKKCRVCHKDEVCEIFFGDEDKEDALFIELQDCSHIIEVKALDNWIKGSHSSSGSNQVKFRTCPKCKTPIRKSLRYGNIIKTVLSDVESIKSRQLKTSSDLFSDYIEAKAAILKIGDTSYVQSDLEDLRQSIHKPKPVDNWYRATGIKFKLSILPNILKVYHITNSIGSVKISGCSPRYLNECLSNLKKFIMQDCLSAQQRADSIFELRRLTCAAKLLDLLSKIQSKNRSSEHDEIIYNIKQVYISGWKSAKITEEKEEEICRLIGSISEKYFVNGLSKEERLKIVDAVGLTKGHWFKCPKGHFYCIGECGGAMETSKCPECGSVIGGQNHSLADGNAHAGEIDDSRYAAWSDAANLGNFDPADLARLRL